MNTKGFGLLIFSLVGFGIGYFLLNDYQCGYSVFCYDLTLKSRALLYGMGALTIVSLLLLFLPKAFVTWKKFAIWAVPLVAILFALYPNPGSGDYFSPYPEDVYRFVSAAFVVISVFIIAWGEFKASRK